MTAWRNFNKWWGLNVSTPGLTARRQGTTPTGNHPWNNSYFPTVPARRSSAGGSRIDDCAPPAYVYSMPTEDAFFVAQDSSFTTLNNWWSNHSMPLTSPSPTSS